MPKVCLLVPFLFLIVLVAPAFAQTATPSPTPQTTTTLYFDEILNAFKFGKGKRPSNAELNAGLVEAVKTRGIHFVLTKSERRELIEAGANDELINVIDNALTETDKKKIAAEQKEIDEINGAYQVILDNYKSTDIRRYAAAIKAAKEFINRYGSDERAKDIVTWLKNNLPRWEQRYVID